jgi:hypothetical protein
MTIHEAGQTSVHIPNLLGELADPARQQTQRDPSGLQHPRSTALFLAAHVGEPRTGPEEGSVLFCGVG